MAHQQLLASSSNPCSAARSLHACSSRHARHSLAPRTAFRSPPHQGSPSPVAAQATVIDGKETAATIRKEIAEEVAQLKARSGKVSLCVHVEALAHALSICTHGFTQVLPACKCFGEVCLAVRSTRCPVLSRSLLQTPGLAVVLVGNRKDSETYVRSKKKSCAEVGIESFGTELPAEATQDEILKVRVTKHGH